MIKRYDIRVCDEYSNCNPLVEDYDGDYVAYEDFKKATDCLMRIVNSETYISSTILKSDANKCLKELGFEFKEVFPVVKKEGYKKVGFWFSPSETDLPKPKDFIDLNWDETEKQIVLNHINDRKLMRTAYRGSSQCRICHCMNGSEDITDGTYVWPSGFAHYITEHGVKPPKDFIAHCLGLTLYEGHKDLNKTFFGEEGINFAKEIAELKKYRENPEEMQRRRRDALIQNRQNLKDYKENNGKLK